VLVLITLISWLFLYSGLYDYIMNCQPNDIMTTISRSIVVFVIIYCAFVPLLYGICLAVIAKCIVTRIQLVSATI
jgi:hypothetical protein